MFDQVSGPNPKKTMQDLKKSRNEKYATMWEKFVMITVDPI